MLAGETLELYLQVRDRDGNARRGEEDDVAFEVRAVEETKAQLKEERRVRDAVGGGTQAVVALGSGVYALRIVREAAGEYYALPTVGGDAAPEVAFTVEPAAACGPRCDLSGAAATRKTCEVHVRMPLVVLVRDAFGNARLNHLDAAAEDRVEALVDEGEGFAEPMVACGGGLHAGAIVGTRPGPLRVRVAVQGKTAKLITLAVHAGPSVARQCQVTNGNGWQQRVPTSRRSRSRCTRATLTATRRRAASTRSGCCCSRSATVTMPSLSRSSSAPPASTRVSTSSPSRVRTSSASRSAPHTSRARRSSSSRAATARGSSGRAGRSRLQLEHRR